MSVPSDVHAAIDNYTHFYRKLFAESTETPPPALDRYLASLDVKLTAQEKASLTKPASVAELRAALEDAIENDTSEPGPDGITYQNWHTMWDTAHEPLLELANTVLSAKLKQGMQVLDVLIEYSDNVARPSVIASTAFKIVNNLLALRLKPILNRIIARETISRGSDSLVDCVRPLAGDKWCLLVDLSMAFDTLNMGFLKSILNHLQVPSVIVDSIIQQCTCSTARLCTPTAISSELIPLARGINEGLPLTPLLLHLALEPLIRTLTSQFNGQSYTLANASHMLPFTCDPTVVLCPDAVLVFHQNPQASFQADSYCASLALGSTRNPKISSLSPIPDSLEHIINILTPYPLTG